MVASYFLASARPRLTWWHPGSMCANCSRFVVVTNLSATRTTPEPGKGRNEMVAGSKNTAVYWQFAVKDV